MDGGKKKIYIFFRWHLGVLFVAFFFLFHVYTVSIMYFSRSPRFYQSLGDGGGSQSGRLTGLSRLRGLALPSELASEDVRSKVKRRRRSSPAVSNAIVLM